MNKHYLLLLSILMMLSFSTGIFVEMVVYSPSSISLTPTTFWSSLLGTWKQDLFTVLVAAFFTFTVYLAPALILFILGKTFSLGFSAAYLLASQNNGLNLLLALLLPRALLKIPAYLLLVSLSLHAIRQRKRKRRPNIKGFALCFLFLLLSSLIEVCLLQAVL